MFSGSRSVGQSVSAAGLCVVVLAFTLAGCGSSDSEIDGVHGSSGSATGNSGSMSGANELPIIDGMVLRPFRPSPGREVRVNARVSDADGDPTTVEFVWQTERGRVLGKGRIFDTTGLAPGARLEVVATPSDGRATGLPFTHEFRLSEPSMAIELVAIDASDGTKPGAILDSVVEVRNEDSGRAEIELEWKVNGEVVGGEDELDTAPFQPGDVVILRARLENDDGAVRFKASSTVVLSRGESPEILSEPLAGIEAGMFRYKIRARSDEPGAELSYGLLSGPEGMTVDEKSGLVSWRPTDQQRGRFEVEVSATDQWDSGIAQSFVIVAEAPGSAPASPR